MAPGARIEAVYGRLLHADCPLPTSTVRRALRRMVFVLALLQLANAACSSAPSSGPGQATSDEAEPNDDFDAEADAALGAQPDGKMAIVDAASGMRGRTQSEGGARADRDGPSSVAPVERDAGRADSATTGAAPADDGEGDGMAGPPSGPWPPSATFQNPVLWQDLADDEVIRVGDVFYYTASNMHYSPGAPILRSYDLVHWEYAGHALPTLDFGPKYNLTGGHAYIKGSWASTLQYRESEKRFYWLGCIEFGKTYIYTASDVAGPWQRHAILDECYYDAGMLVDHDDTVYVAYGNTRLSVAQLSGDLKRAVKTQQVYAANGMTLEGARFFKHDGDYFIFLTRPADGQFILRSSTPFGPYSLKSVIDRNRGPVASAGVPHQGGMVETAAGDWYYMAFIDSYPGGRVPVLAPVTWGADGWPKVELVNGAWAASYAYPRVPRPPRATKSPTGTDTFRGAELGHEWEWNHNPDNEKWSLGDGLTLETATVTNDLYKARNTLTRRIHGPSSTATVELDLSAMTDGDVAGLALLRQFSAYIAVKQAEGRKRVVMVDGLSMDRSWNTTSTGKESGASPLSGGSVWLRLSVDIRPGAGRKGTFFYSTDGVEFEQLGPGYVMNNSWEFFMGYRFAIFNFATTTLGGAVKVKSFRLSTP